MKKKNKIILALTILILLCGVATGIILHNASDGESVVDTKKIDVEWYSETGETFTITTAEELYDLAALSDFYDFKGQTILLGADITVNEGNAEDWMKDAPEKQWFPIQGFAGTFDGQGHTISGLYGVGVSAPMGLFSDTHSKCKIRDFKLVNSYFYVDGSQGAGSIASNGSGTFEKIYSSAIVASNRHYVGGLIGRIDSGKESAVVARATKISDCWFDGEVYLTSDKSRMGGGFIGGIANGAVKVEHSLSSGSIYCADKEEAYNVGGFCGMVGVVGESNANATLHMEDCLQVGTVDTVYKISAGSYVGNIVKGATVDIKNSYAQKSELTSCDVIGGTLNGTVLILKEQYLLGTEAYRWTELDFEKYWSAMQGETPVLAYFAEGALGLDGVTKAYNMDWYNEDASEFVINTVEELYGFQMLCNQKVNFKDKTVKLGADIIVNEGKATDWAKGINIPLLEWTPIGGGGNKYMPFSGTFDGQGHTISGLYMKSDDYYLGLFGVLAAEGTATVKNLKLTNSYFESTRTDMQAGEIDGLGSIAGQGAGTLDTIYSDVILVNGTRNTGGLVGNLRQQDAVLNVENCWYNGKVTGTFWIGGIVGFVHGTAKQTNIKDCLVTADLTSTMKDESAYIGGLAGRTTGGTIASCLVSGEFKGPGAVCGFVGLSMSTSSEMSITKCYNASNVTKMYQAGAGQTYSLMLKNISEEELIGTKGYANTLLDFYIKGSNNSGRWVAVKNATPGLKSFTSGSTLGLSQVARTVMQVDISWYNASKQTYTIKNVNQLYGLAELCNSGISFEGKTIKLEADVKVNDGKASDWAQGKNLPTYTWTPIGGGVTSEDYMPFAGTFDGQGHTISGIYTKSGGYYLGLFGVLAADGSATVKNLKLTNSYFECTRTDMQGGEVDGLGSIAGQAAGTIDTVYSDAVLVNGTRNTGGMVGNVRHDKATLQIQNCWYDGEITGTFWIGGMIGFVHGSTKETNLSNCLVTAELTSTLETENSYMGGLSGRALAGTYSSCVAVGTLTGNGSVCGFIGASATPKPQTLELSKCYNATNIEKQYIFYNHEDYNKPAVSIVENIDADKLEGTNAYINTWLDFYDASANKNGKWVLVQNEVTQLKSFADAGYISSLGSLNSAIRPIIEDTSWYNETKTEFVIDTIEELYGFAKLCNEGNTFAGKTVKLGADVKANVGYATDWAKGENLPSNTWTPIGGGEDSLYYRPFAGTFDGQGHTISGLYLKSEGYYLGLFGVLSADGSATVKNLKLTNSYFECTRTSMQGGEIDGLGSIAGQAAGNLNTIYSDAILVNGTRNTGGLVGNLRHDKATLTVQNCWYDGNITGTMWIGGIVGFVHGITGGMTLTDCLVTADLTSTLTSGNALMGGLSGRALVGEFSSCVAIGTLTGPSGLCGLVGNCVTITSQTLEMSKCYNATNATTHYTYNTSNGYKQPTLSEVRKVTVEEIKGTNVYANTLLSFYDKDENAAGRWVIVEESSPELLSFATSYMSSLDSLNGVVRPVVVDTSWYDAGKTEFVINTLEELYGLAQLCNNGTTFAGKTIKLGADIKGNNGLATDWAQGKNIPLNMWTPIGGGLTSMDYRPFAGTFDGQGHTISGLYVKSAGLYLGLFGVLHADGSATVKNLKLTNTYFECTRTTVRAGEIDGLGGIAGQGAGTIDTVYTDAILVNGTNNTGGFVGTHRHENAPLSINNCWFDGEITGTNWIGGLVGFVHGSVAYTNLKDCLVTADLTSTMQTGDAYVGGLTGRLNGGTITSCVASGNITGTKARGLIGISVTLAGKSLLIAKCYNATNIATAYTTGYGTPTISEVKTVSEDHLKGTAAYTNTLLEFYVKDKNESGKWVAINGGLPQLKSFADTNSIVDVSGLSRTVTANTAWYNASKTEFVLCTPGELYGLAQLCNNGNTFAGKTIKLGMDIKVNEGLAIDWAKNKNLPTNTWTPIGGGPKSLDYRPFAGTFDGQGYTISGLYMKSEGFYLGLFGVLHADGSAAVKNLKLTNSYFECSRTVKQGGELDGLGGIAGQGAGTIDTVYTDVILVNKTNNTGGIVGNQRHSGTVLNVKNTWYDGNITGAMWMGGILGFVHGTATSTNMEDCLVTADITSTLTSGNAVIGGISGRAIAGKMTSCVAVGTLTGPGFMGGLVGLSATQNTHTWELTNCYNATNITKQYNPGAKQPTLSHVVNLNVGQLKGLQAYANTKLSFYDKNSNTLGKWVLVADKLPELRSFAASEFMDDLSSLSGMSRPQ